MTHHGSLPLRWLLPLFMLACGLGAFLMMDGGQQTVAAAPSVQAPSDVAVQPAPGDPSVPAAADVLIPDASGESEPIATF